VLGIQERVPNRQTLLQQALEGRLPTHSQKQEYAMKELRRVAAELRVSEIARAVGLLESMTITQIVINCKNNSALFAAKEGIAFPPIGTAT
jgi:hypothetical protein